MRNHCRIANMPNTRNQRRIQFSSCDACRRSRVACDASKRRNDLCSRCSRRKQPCTFNWMRDSKKSPKTPQVAAEEESSISRSHCEASLHAPVSDSSAPLTSMTEPVRELLARWSNHIFHQTFDNIFGLLLGRHGCPFVYVEGRRMAL